MRAIVFPRAAAVEHRRVGRRRRPIKPQSKCTSSRCSASERSARSSSATSRVPRPSNVIDRYGCMVKDVPRASGESRENFGEIGRGWCDAERARILVPSHSLVRSTSARSAISAFSPTGAHARGYCGYAGRTMHRQGRQRPGNSAACQEKSSASGKALWPHN